MYQYPYGNAQQLNLDWLMEQWQTVKQSIDGSLQGEIDRVEAAITDLLAARDAAVAAAGAANTSAGAAAASAQAAAADAATATAQAAAATQERVNAAQAANNAQSYAGNAQTQAAAAQNAAGQAAASASQAAAAASDAHDDALSASGSAVNAAASAAGALQNFQLSDAARQAAQAAEQDAEAAATLLQPPATAADIGKALIVKTVGGGTVTAYELGESGGGGTPAIVNTIEDVPIASFDDGTVNPVQQLLVDIEPVQAGSGDPAPDNVRPITGWTGAKITQSGVNLFDKTNTFDGYINDSNGQYTAASGDKCTDFISVKGGESYRIITEQTSGMWAAWYDKNKQFISGINGYTENPVKTAPENAAYIRLTIVRTGNGNIDTFALNYPSTDLSYHSFTGALYEVTFPTEAGTVYYGHIDFIRKKLIVDGAIVDLGNLNWQVYSDFAVNRFFSSDLTNTIKKPQTQSEIVKTICTQFKYIPQSASWNTENIYSITTNGLTYVMTNAYSDAAAFKTAMNGVILAYPLATSIEYDIADVPEINILSGNNNILPDTGNINLLQYYADSKKYIDEQDALIKALIAPVLDVMIADTALTANDFRIVDNTLYRITAPVAAGAALTPNTNCTATTIVAILKTLLT